MLAALADCPEGRGLADPRRELRGQPRPTAGAPRPHGRGEDRAAAGPGPPRPARCGVDRLAGPRRSGRSHPRLPQAGHLPPPAARALEGSVEDNLRHPFTLKAHRGSRFDRRACLELLEGSGPRRGVPRKVEPRPLGRRSPDRRAAPGHPARPRRAPARRADRLPRPGHGPGRRGPARRLVRGAGTGSVPSSGSVTTWTRRSASPAERCPCGPAAWQPEG